MTAWTHDEKRTLTAAITGGATIPACARLLGRSEQSVKGQIHRMLRDGLVGKRKAGRRPKERAIKLPRRLALCERRGISLEDLDEYRFLTRSKKIPPAEAAAILRGE